MAGDVSPVAMFKVTVAIDGMVPAQPLGPMVFDGFHSVNHW